MTGFDLTAVYNSAMSLRRAAIGFRAHSGWAALVAVAGSPKAPEIIARKRIEIADPKLEGSKQPFHAVEPMELADAERMIRDYSASTNRLAQEAIQGAIDGLRDRGYEVAVAGITLASGRALPGLQQILASHALIHTAEGEFFRQALIDACEHCGLTVTGLKERELFECGAKCFRTSIAELQPQINAIGKSIGPPWTLDQKHAALVGWIALAGPRAVGDSRGTRATFQPRRR